MASSQPVPFFGSSSCSVGLLFSRLEIQEYVKNGILLHHGGPKINAHPPESLSLGKTRAPPGTRSTVSAQVLADGVGHHKHLEITKSIDLRLRCKQFFIAVV